MAKRDPTQFLRAFGAKLDRAIEEAGTSQSALSQVADVSQSAISAMTRGAQRPYLDQALAMAKALGVSLDYLADPDCPEPPPDLPAEDRQILDLVRALRLDKEEALRRISGQPPTPPAAPAPPAPGYAAPTHAVKTALKDSPHRPKRKDKGADPPDRPRRVKRFGPGGPPSGG